MTPFGKLAIILAILLVITSMVIIVANKTFPLGKLPGVLTIEKKNSKFYLPFTTSAVVSGSVAGLAALIAVIF